MSKAKVSKRSITGRQQGDVLLIDTALPADARKLTPQDASSRFQRGGFVLAEGEATGHAHVLAGEPGQDFEVFTVGEGMDERTFIKCMTAAPLTHEEHHVQTPEPGRVFEVRRVAEYDWTQQMMRPVED